MEKSIHFITNPGAVVPVGAVNYDETIGLNIKVSGSDDLGGNWNEPNIDHSTTTTVSANLVSLNSGSTTGISCAITTAAVSNDISNDSTSFTTNFPAGSYRRGARVNNSNVYALTFSGFPNSTPIRVRVALFVTTTVFATENGTLAITDGASTMGSTFNCTSPLELTFEGTADSSGDVVVSITADSGATNGVGMCAVIIQYVS